jgi:plastocyanin
MFLTIELQYIRNIYKPKHPTLFKGGVLMKIRNLAIILVVLTMLIAVGCAKQAPAPASKPAPVAEPEPVVVAEPVAEPEPVVEEEVAEPAPQSGDVILGDAGFEPSELTVAVGATVVFENQGKSVGIVSSKARGFNSGRLVSGDKWEHTFEEAGTFEYLNTIKASQKGTIVVE